MLAYLFIALAVAVHLTLLPHPWMFTPVVGSLLFFGARGPRRQLWIPFALLAVSDVLLDKFVYHYPFLWDQFITWAWYAAILWLGTNLRENAKPWRVIVAALASSAGLTAAGCTESASLSLPSNSALAAVKERICS